MHEVTVLDPSSIIRYTRHNTDDNYVFGLISLELDEILLIVLRLKLKSLKIS